MIAYITGAIIKRWEQSIIVNVSGVGYHIAVPDTTALSDDHVSLWVYTYWNTETGPVLYGFVQESERHVFEVLIQASGVGPRLGLQCLATIPVDQLVTALSQEDTQTLSQIPGIGGQKAKKIAFHLRDKAAELVPTIAPRTSGSAQVLYDVRNALTSLGYTRHEIDRAISHITIDSEDRFDVVLRKALSQLSQ